MENNLSNPLPKMLPGAVCRQWVRCGRLNCRCAGGSLHGPYFFRFWREHGRLLKQYVRKVDVDRVRGECEARRRARWELAAAREQWRKFVVLLRETEKSWKT